MPLPMVRTHHGSGHVVTDVATALKWAREFGPNSPAQVLADALETAEKERDAARRQLARITVDPSPPDIEVWNGLRALEGLDPAAEVPAWHVVDERDQAIRERDAALEALRKLGPIFGIPRDHRPHENWHGKPGQRAENCPTCIYYSALAGSEPTEAERPPESVFRYFRELHGLPDEKASGA